MTEPNAAPDQEPAPQSEPAPDKKNTIQERISKLYGQLKEEQENHSVARADNEQLRTQLLQVQEELNALKAREPISPPPFGAPTAVPSSGDVDIKKVVAEAVREAVGPISEAFTQRQAAEQLHAQQIQSLQRAAAEFPELRDQNSELFKATDLVLKRDKSLANRPDGPQIAAVIARGLLMDRPVGQPDPQQRVAAASPQAGTGPAPSPSKEDADAVRGQLEDARKRLREADDGPERQQLWTQVNQLRRKLAGSVQE